MQHTNDALNVRAMGIAVLVATVLAMAIALVFAGCGNPVGSSHTHAWGEWTVTKPATETEDGEETRFCQDDPSHTETRVIPKTGPIDDIPVTGVTLNETTLVLQPGDTEILGATVAPSDATNKAVTWESDNEAIATVDENGTVTAVAAGTAIITVTTADGGKTASCTVSVKKQEIFTIDFADAAPEIEEPTIHRSSANGPTTATVAVANASDYDSIKWSINGTGISVTENFIILDSANQAYNRIGKYSLSVEVFKNGVPYNRTVSFTVKE